MDSPLYPRGIRRDDARMTAQADPYVRVYYRIIDEDPKFHGVYDSNDRLATWLRLLLAADAMYPAPATIPHGIHKPSLAFLVSVGLVDLTPGGRYRIHGMEAERASRRDHASNAARIRWASREQSSPDAPSNAPGNAQSMHSSPIRSAPIQSEPLLSPPEHGTTGQKTKREKTDLTPVRDLFPPIGSRTA